MKLHEIKIKLELFRREVKMLESIPIKCPTCVNYQPVKGVCVKYQQSPPASVIETGCEEFEYDDIPF